MHHNNNRGIAWIGNPGIAFVADRSYLGCQSRVLLMDRGMQLRIKGHLYEIEEIDDEIIGNAQGLESAKTGYQRTLKSVADRAGTELVDRVANDIKEHIRSREERPRNADVRVDARMLLADEDIVAGDYLNSA